MTVIIQPANSDQIEELIDLQTLAISVLQSGKYDEKQIRAIIKIQRNVRRKGYERMFIAKSNDEKIVGFGSLLEYCPYIGGIYVHPDFIHQRIGTQLLEAVEDAALSKRIRILYVMSSLEAVGFYEANGYKFLRNSGFFAKGQIRIPCIFLNKELIPFTPVEKLWRRIIQIATWVLLGMLIVSIIL